MGIAALSDWLKQALEPKQTPLIPEPAPRKQPTIQPGVPLPTYTPQANGDYTVQGLAPGASTFAERFGLGVLKNPPQGVVYFDPTGQANDQHPGYRGNYLAVPMAMPEFKQFPYLDKIGSF